MHFSETLSTILWATVLKSLLEKANWQETWITAAALKDRVVPKTVFLCHVFPEDSVTINIEDGSLNHAFSTVRCIANHQDVLQITKFLSLWFGKSVRGLRIYISVLGDSADVCTHTVRSQSRPMSGSKMHFQSSGTRLQKFHRGSDEDRGSGKLVTFLPRVSLLFSDLWQRSKLAGRCYLSRLCSPSWLICRVTIPFQLPWEQR